MGFLLNAEDVRFGTDVTDSFNATDFGFALGIGVKIPVSDKLKLFFEYEGQGGVSDIFKVNEFSRVTNSRSSLNHGLYIAHFTPKVKGANPPERAVYRTD